MSVAADLPLLRAKAAESRAEADRLRANAARLRARAARMQVMLAALQDYVGALEAGDRALAYRTLAEFIGHLELVTASAHPIRDDRTVKLVNAVKDGALWLGPDGTDLLARAVALRLHLIGKA